MNAVHMVPQVVGGPYTTCNLSYKIWNLAINNGFENVSANWYFVEIKWKKSCTLATLSWTK